MVLIVLFFVLVGWVEFVFYGGYVVCVLYFYKLSFIVIFLILDVGFILILCIFIIVGCYFKVL